MAASMGRQFPIVVLGSTGTGKSKLALEIASKYKGEIISTDSMQIYQGLDIVTNKVTRSEQQQCLHHMLNFVDPLTNYDVVQYRDKALPIIKRILAEKKTPIIVGGTNYYIEALLWNTLLAGKEINESNPRKDAETVANSGGQVGTKWTEDGSTEQMKLAAAPPGGSTREQCENSPPGGSTTPQLLDPDWEELTSQQLHQKLVEVDPDSAKRIHPNDRRKTKRALQVYHERGVRMSTLLAAQHSQPGAGDIRGTLRYPDACVIWIRCDQQVLSRRTDKRVDQMIEDGLLAEMLDFHQKYNQQRIKENKEATYTGGIFQSIGFKEFHPYLMLSEEERESEDGQKLFQQGVSRMKTITRKYANEQVRWVKNRLLKKHGDNVLPVYAVDSTDPSKYDQHVLQPALEIVEAFAKGETPHQAPLPCEDNTNVKQHNVCDVCDLVFITSDAWAAHIKGRRHKKAVEHKNKLAKRKAQMEETEREKQLSDTNSKVQKLSDSS